MSNDDNEYTAADVREVLKALCTAAFIIVSVLAMLPWIGWVLSAYWDWCRGIQGVR